MNIYIFRTKQTEQGTEGVLCIPELSFRCYTLELPWDDNKQTFSCIPFGKYVVKLRLSPKYGRTYQVENVPNRSHILIHSGNWAGDRRLHLKSHTYGCILLGKNRGWLQKQRAVLSSRVAVNELMDILQEKDFTLIIEEIF